MISTPLPWIRFSSLPDTKRVALDSGGRELQCPHPLVGIWIPQVRRIRVSGKDMVQIARFWESR
ncbi:hypothetical protein DSO57_1037197 [Entomophthora muscae]|uniref:Uncharacterized protein n=1 Tax=Entomophthora muscae TaxID=34485 RepID=A0ACC2RQ10_9FUNG|nr:hypothetical protein DSO57_1037197 [Entomophthora muscae]